MTLADSRRRLIEWVGDQAPMSDATPEDWTKFKARLDGLIRQHEEIVIDDFVAHRDSEEAIRDAAGDAEFEASRNR